MDRARQEGNTPDTASSRRFYDLAAPISRCLSDGFLATDMYETDSAIVVQVVMPGVSTDDLKITRMGDTVTLEGSVEPGSVEDSRYLYRERSYGTFRRNVVLPEGVEEDLNATLQNGILSLEFAKPVERVPRAITVKPAEQ